MHRLTLDAVVTLALTIMNVVQLAVARDRRCSSTLACDAVYFSSPHEAEARKSTRRQSGAL